MNTLTSILTASLAVALWANPVLPVSQTNQIAQSEKRVVDPEGIAEFSVKTGKHSARIIFETKLFNPSNHRITRAGGCVTIDGRTPLGTDCGIPQVEIASMRFFLNGKEIPIPTNLYADCYSPPPFKYYKEKGWIDGYLSIKFSDDSKNVFVFLAAGDGAGVYDVVWVLRNDGRHTRFTESGNDCRFLNFYCRPR